MKTNHRVGDVLWSNGIQNIKRTIKYKLEKKK